MAIFFPFFTANPAEKLDLDVMVKVETQTTKVFSTRKKLNN